MCGVTGAVSGIEMDRYTYIHIYIYIYRQTFQFAVVFG